MMVILIREGTAVMITGPGARERDTMILLSSSVCSVMGSLYTSVKIIKNEVGCRDDTVPKTVDTRRHCEEE